MRRSSIQLVEEKHCYQYKNVHYHLSIHLRPTLGVHSHTYHLIIPSTRNSDVTIIKHKRYFSDVIMEYISNLEARLSAKGYRVKRLRCDNARENSPKDLTNSFRSLVISMNQSPSYECKINCIVESFVQEHWIRALLLLLATYFPHSFCEETLCHENDCKTGSHLHYIMASY